MEWVCIQEDGEGGIASREVYLQGGVVCISRKSASRWLCIKKGVCIRGDGLCMQREVGQTPPPDSQNWESGQYVSSGNGFSLLTQHLQTHNIFPLCK